ncbi:MAG: hypothetical protein HUJ42_00795 [Malacoplasma sp.]|nr:hypothetical protein [Malacoplasma sp.]
MVLAKKLILICGVGVTTVSAVAAASVLTAKNNNNSNSQSNQTDVQQPETTTPTTSTPSIAPASVTGTDDTKQPTPIVTPVEERTGVLASSVTYALNNLYFDFQNADPNDYGVNQNYLEYSENANKTAGFSKFNSSQFNTTIDINMWVNSLWRDNNKDVDFNSVSITNYRAYNTKANKIILDQSTISFDLQINIFAFKKAPLIIFNNIFFLEANTHYTLTVKATNQVVKGIVNKYASKYYLGWQLDDVDVNFRGAATNSSFKANFVPTKDSYSYALQYTFNHLSDKQNYVQLYSQQQSKLDNLDISTVKKQVAAFYQQDYANTLDFVDMGIQLLGIIKSNPSVKDLAVKATPIVAKILSQINILPAFFQPLLSLASTSISSDEPFINIFNENKSVVIDWINTNYAESANILVPLVNAISSNMTADQFSDIKGLLEYLKLDPAIVDVVLNDFLGMNGKPKSLFNIIKDNVAPILNLVLGSSVSSDVHTGIADLISIIFQYDVNNSYIPIFTAIFKDTDTKKRFFNDLTKIINLSSVGNILDVLVVNNNLINTDNITAIFNSIYNFVSQLFERKAEYNKNDFTNGYTNLSFKSEFVQDPSISKVNNNNVLNFKYQITFHINKKITLDLSPLKGLVNGQQIWDLIASVEPSVSALGPLVNKDWLYQSLIAFVPSSITVGGDVTSDVTSLYTANNATMYFSPIANGSNYDFGFKFDYTTRISYRDQTLLNSITKNYNSVYDWHQIVAVVGWVDLYYAQFWESIFANILMRDFQFTNRANVQYSNEVVANTSNFDPNLYITGFNITPTESKLNDNAKNNILSKTQKANKVAFFSTSKYTLNWSDTSISYTYGIEPWIPSDVNNLVFNYLVSINNSAQTQEYIANTNLTYKYYSDALLNFNIPIQVVVKYIVGLTNVNVNLNVFLMDFNLYLPFLYYDTVNHQMTDHYSMTLSNFGISTTSKTSLFWNQEYYRW